MSAPLFVVRLYDMFDGWIDVFGPASDAECQAYWNRETVNGTKNTRYSDGDYWKVFPADTMMLHAPEYRGR